MRNFALLFNEIDETTKPDLKINALVNYFRKAAPGDAAWTVSLLLGRKITRVVSIKELQKWSVELTQIPEWLFGDCRNNVGDLAETISLILIFDGNTENIPLQILIEQYLIPLKNQEEQVQKEKIISVWSKLNSTEKYILNKLITGSFRIDVSPRLLIKALSSFSGLTEAIISYRMAGNWTPSVEFFNWLCATDVTSPSIYNAYPFYNAIKLNQKVEELGEINQWLAEWKWKGIRSQIIKKENKVFIWSQEQDFLNDSFPELYELGSSLPDGTVIDGIIVSIKDNVPLSSTELNKRIAKRYPVKKVLSDCPVSFIVFDLLEFEKLDIRSKPLNQRRNYLINLLNEINDNRLILSLEVEGKSWNDLKIAKSNANKNSTNGLILKRLDSPYSTGIDNIANSQQSGIATANWYEWKNDPLTILAVLLYARLEQGSTSPLFKEYTFALRHEGNVVPFAKTSSGLTDEEVIRVDAFIRNNTLEKFGPVRTVKPELIFELEFDGVQKSSWHKSGIFVNSPRITRWDHDKKIEEIGSLSSLIVNI
jgi:DNA ligase 1